MQTYTPQILPIKGLDYQRLFGLVGNANAALARYDVLVSHSFLFWRQSIYSNRYKSQEETMKEIIGINHIGIRVESLDRTRAFYEQLGFVFLIGPIGSEPVAMMEHPSGVNINFILNADLGIIENILMDVKTKHSGYTHIALDVNDIQAVQSRLECLGIGITEGPITLPNGGIMLFIRDPDNNVIEFHQDV